MEDNKELEKIVDEVIDFTEDKDSFERYQELENKRTSKVKLPPIMEISLEAIYKELLHGRSTMLDIKDNVITKKQEKIDTLKRINDSLLYLKRHFKKWFASILILAFISGGISGAVIHKEWDSIAPYIDTVFQISRIVNNTKNLTGD